MNRKRVCEFHQARKSLVACLMKYLNSTTLRYNPRNARHLLLLLKPSNIAQQHRVSFSKNVKFTLPMNSHHVTLAHNKVVADSHNFQGHG